jgi:hypothetical protein
VQLAIDLPLYLGLLLNWLVAAVSGNVSARRFLTLAHYVFLGVTVALSTIAHAKHHTGTTDSLRFLAEVG